MDLTVRTVQQLVRRWKEAPTSKTSKTSKTRTADLDEKNAEGLASLILLGVERLSRMFSRALRHEGSFEVTVARAGSANLREFLNSLQLAQQRIKLMLREPEHHIDDHDEYKERSSNKETVPPHRWISNCHHVVEIRRVQHSRRIGMITNHSKWRYMSNLCPGTPEMVTTDILGQSIGQQDEC